MSISARHREGSTVIKRLTVPAGLALLILLVVTGVVWADAPPAATADITATETVTPGSSATTPHRVGGSIHFVTYPAGATIRLDNKVIGVSDFTHYAGQTGTFDVLVQRKGYVDYTGQVTVSEGKRVVFTAVLKEVPRTTPVMETYGMPLPAVTTVTTLQKSTITLPTAWPTSPPQSSVDPAGLCGIAALGIAIRVFRRS